MVLSPFHLLSAIFTHIHNKEYPVNGSQVKQNDKLPFVNWEPNLYINKSKRSLTSIKFQFKDSHIH